MSYLDDENQIIDMLQSEDRSSIYFLSKSEEAVKVFEFIYSKRKWKEWVYSAGKSDPPPDFFTKTYNYMLEIMRVDDHAYKNKKGKLVNPTNICISNVEKEIFKSGIMNLAQNAHLIVNTHTDLPTEKDHNYVFYKKNFKRIVEQHIKQINLYKHNHPKYKMVFLVMDESSAYVEKTEDVKDNMQCNKYVKGYPHFWFFDLNFLRIILNSDIDFLIWYTPFKFLYTNKNIVDLPKVCILDIKNINIQMKEYNEQNIISSEI